MLSLLLWIARMPLRIVAAAISIVMAVILMPLKMLAFGLLINVAMFLGLILIVAAVIYFIVIR
ncbi:MAG: hypothetical protein E3J81_05630 [Dehalococcoidia bacterium]|nr:MAG: hypothetical protein E3J81_05630 [Dehalococcoidia bacterium]